MRLLIIILAMALPCVRICRYLKGIHRGAELLTLASLSALAISLWLLISYLSGLAKAQAISTIYDTAGGLSSIYGILTLVTLGLNFLSLLPTVRNQSPKKE